MAAITITKAEITAGLERESSFQSINLTDGNNVSIYDKVFIDNDAVLKGAVNEAVNNLTQNMQKFMTSPYSETNAEYNWTLSKRPDGIKDDMLNYIVDFTMNEWCLKVLKDKENSFAGRAVGALKNVARKLYFKSCPV